MFFGVDPLAAPNPDFFGLADLRVRVVFEKGDLPGKFGWPPEIVRVEQRDKIAGRTRNPRITGGTDALVGLVHAGDAPAVGL